MIELRPRGRGACLVVMAATLGGCGGGHDRPVRHLARNMGAPVVSATAAPAERGRTAVAGASPHRRPPAPLALVAAESADRVLVVNLRTQAVTRRMALAGGPQYVDGEIGLAVASSPAAGTVSVLTGPRWHVRAVIHGFLSPHIVALSPDGDHAFVTDDRRGTLSVIRLTDDRVTATLPIGTGAHHLAASPDQQRLWVALGESAQTIVMINTSDVERPRIVGRFHPTVAAHDVAFSPDGREVWVTSASDPDVSVLDARNHRVLFRVPVGPPPQHVAFFGGSAYLTSGYGSEIERVAPATGTVERRAHTPYGSFELSAAAGYVVTASLLNGEMAVFTQGLRPLDVLRLASATRDVSVVQPQGP